MVEFRILGPLEVSHQGRPVEVGGSRQRALLAHLLLDANRVVSSDRLIDELWGETPPEGAGNALQAAVSRLRRALGGDVALLTRPPGYVLEIEKEALDLHRFEGLRAEGAAALGTGDPATASARLHEALSLWRGPALADFAYEPFAQGEIARLEELRLATIEDRIEADLQCGRQGELAGELEALVRDHPLRERFRAQMMLALYRSGRQGEALEAYRASRDTLVEELGIEPGPDLRDLHERILHQDPALAPPSARTAEPAVAPVPATPAHPEPSPPLEVRKTVTVVFCDVADSTGLAQRLDPETLRAVMSRYFEVAREAFHRHGGTVEKFIGDAVMAVFGIPALHEDDALRAIRAVFDLTQGLGALNEDLERERGIRLEVRVGVNTGEVVAGDSSTGQALVTGNPVNTAARLEQAAASGEILIGEATRKLVSSAITLEPVSQLSLKGVREAVVAWRLIGMVPGAPPFPRHLDAPLVGRHTELAQLRQAFDRAMSERTVVLCTIIGPPGIGKTRLAHEFAMSVKDDASVFWGRCLPYGEGITYWPLREIALEAFGEEVREGIRTLLKDDPDAEAIADRVAGAIGIIDRSFPTEEIAWAGRRTLEELGKRRPLVVVLEDAHWAETTFLDLVEYIAKLAAEVPIELLCLARPELLEDRAGWGGGTPNAVTLSLEPLSEKDAGSIAANLAEGQDLPPEGRERAIAIAEGNPLFLEQLLAAEAEYSSGAEFPIPPTIAAVLAARLERLGPGERTILERAAVIGKEFSRDALAALLPDAAQGPMPRHLDALVQKRYLRMLPSEATGERVHAFRHVLIVDAAYRGVPKALRAKLHERVADWMEDRLRDRIQEFDEILGYHLEQAHAYRTKLGPPDEITDAIGRRAGRSLGSAGRRAFDRGDMPGVVHLLERAAGLLPSDDPERLDLILLLGRAYTETGRHAAADAALAECIRRARIARDRRREWRAIIERWLQKSYVDTSWIDSAVPDAQIALVLFEELGDEAGLATTWRLIYEARWQRGQFVDGEEALERSIDHARLAGDRRLELECLAQLPIVAFWGPTTTTDKGVDRCHEIVERAGGDRKVEAVARHGSAGFLALQGRFDEAREEERRALDLLRDLGLTAWTVATGHLRGYIELLAGDAVAAEREWRDAYDLALKIGATSDVADKAARLSQALYLQDRLDEAERYTLIAEEAGADQDPTMICTARSVRAKVFARKGRLEEAEDLARTAVEIVRATEDIASVADTLMDLAEVLRISGRDEDARPALQQALDLYEQNGNVVLAQKARAVLEELGDRTR